MISRIVSFLFAQSQSTQNRAKSSRKPGVSERSKGSDEEDDEPVDSDYESSLVRAGDNYSIEVPMTEDRSYSPRSQRKTTLMFQSVLWRTIANGFARMI